MAIFHLKQELTLIFAKFIENLKAVEQSLKDMEETQLDIAQRAISGSTGLTYLSLS